MKVSVRAFYVTILSLRRQVLRISGCSSLIGVYPSKEEVLQDFKA